MNKLPIQILFFAFAITMLCSCSQQSSISLTKRHYRSGYYVDFGTKIHTYKTQKVATVNDKETSEPLALDITKTEKLCVADPAFVTPEKIAVSKKNTESKKNNTYKKEIADNVSSQQDVITPGSSITNTVEGTTATQDHVTVYVVDVPFVIILLCAIFIPPLGVGLMYGPNIYFWVDLLLTLLFFIPGLIFALVVVLM